MRLKTAVCLLVSVVLGLSALGFAAANTTAESPLVASIKNFMGMEASLSPASSFDHAAPKSEVEAPALALLTENFSYSAGQAITSNSWIAHSASGSSPIRVSSGGLSYPGYASSGIGNAANLAFTSGEDDNKAFTSTNTGAIYLSAMVNLTSTQTTGDYFLHLTTANGASPGTFVAKVFAKKDSASNKFAFGVSKGANAGNYTPFDYSLYTTYFVVLKYTFVSGTLNDTVDLFVNPVPGAAEPALTVTSLDNLSGTDANSLAGVALRQGTASQAPTGFVDGIRVGTQWADVTPFGATPPTLDVGVDRPNGSLEGQSVTFNAVVSSPAPSAPDSAVLWQQAHNISGDTDVSTAGTFVSGANVAGPAVTVNGVSFDTLPAGGATTDGVFSFATGEPNAGYNGYGAGNAPFSNLSANYQSLLSTGNFGSGNSVMTLNLNNLTVGATYQIEVWYNDSRGGNQGMTATSGSDSVHAWGNTTATVGGTGQWVIGTFTAGAATKTITFQGDAGAGTLTNAFLLRQLSQPVVPLAGKNVEFRDGDCSTGTVIGSAATNSRGLASVTTNTLSVATHTISACFAGDAGYSASSKSLTHVVNGVPTITLGTTALNDFGSVAAGSFSGSQSTSITAQYLGSESIYCAYPNFNFQLSTDNATWNYQNIVIPTTGGAFNGTLYVRFSPQAGTPGPVGGNIVCQSNPSGQSQQTLGVSGTDLVPPDFTSSVVMIEGHAFSTNIIISQGYPVGSTCSRQGGDNFPSGISLASDCTLSGTPATGTHGQYNVLVKASNGTPPDTQHNLQINVYNQPVITSANNAVVAEGGTLNFQFTADSYPQNVWQLGPGSDPLPTGVTFNGGYTGTLTGTPAFGTAGVYHLVIQANNGQTPITDQPFTLFVTPAGPTAWWAASGDARDITGHGFDGTLIGGAGYAVGKVGQAFSFNGVDSSVSVPSTPVTATDNWTMETWIKLSNLNQAGMVMSNGYDNGSTGDGYAFGIGNGCTGPSCYTPGNRLQALYGGVSFLDGGFTFTSTNQWYHVAMVREAGTLKFYVNGVQTPQTHTIAPTTPTQFRIGSQNGVRFFNGLVDEATIYNRALSQSEIQSVYNAGIAGKAKSAPTPTGTNVSVNAGGDATMTFSSVTTSGLTQQVPIDGSQYPPTPQVPLGLYYDISTSASYTGGVTVCFHLPLVNGQATFNNLRIDHFEGGAWVDRTNLATINFAARTICTNSLSSLSPFAIVSLTPTAAGVTVSGRVRAAGGAGLRNATVVMTDENGETRRVTTNSFGSYVVNDVPAGHSYIMGVESRKFRYATRVVQVSDTLTDVDFFPED
jgi:hypothetical protein